MSREDQGGRATGTLGRAMHVRWAHQNSGHPPQMGRWGRINRPRASRAEGARHSTPTRRPWTQRLPQHSQGNRDAGERRARALGAP